MATREKMVPTCGDTTGALTAAPGSPFLTQNPKGLAVDPKGKFLCVTRDLPDAVSVYTIDSGSCALNMLSSVSVVEQGPHGVAVDPTGKFVYVTNYVPLGPVFQPNLHSTNVSAYAINSCSGVLTS